MVELFYSLHGMTNAFMCTLQEAHDEVIEGITAEPLVAGFFVQRQRNKRGNVLISGAPCGSTVLYSILHSRLLGRKQFERRSKGSLRNQSTADSSSLWA